MAFVTVDEQPIFNPKDHPAGTVIEYKGLSDATREECWARATVLEWISDGSVMIESQGGHRWRFWPWEMSEKYMRLAQTVVVPDAPKCVCPIKDLTSIGHRPGCSKL